MRSFLETATLSLLTSTLMEIESYSTRGGGVADLVCYPSIFEAS